MLVIGVCVLIALVFTLCSGTQGKTRPLGRTDMQRLRRFSEEVRREQVLPFE